eukprot:scaffold6378_cov176-Amphora_coffeaeformis.AAC.13
MVFRLPFGLRYHEDSCRHNRGGCCHKNLLPSLPHSEEEENRLQYFDIFTMVVFDRPVGSPADAKELEYVSGLHQTDAEVRVDGSIKAEDIQLYLKSRFGIDIEREDVTNTILQGMGGGSDDSDVIDL